MWKSYPAVITVSKEETASPVATVAAFGLARIAVADEEDPITVSERQIIVPDELRSIAVQNDENSETVRIVIPRYFDGHDLDQYTAILKTVSSGGRDDITLTKEYTDGSEITFSWTLAPPQTSYSGELQLQIRFVGEDFKWETDKAKVTIIESIDADPAIPLTPSIVESFVEQVAGYASQASDSALEARTNAEQAQQAADSIGDSVQKAETAALDSEKYASEAGTSASQAAESELAASEYRDEAQAIKESTEIQYVVDGTRVGFKRADETDYTYTDDLKGEPGQHGEQGEGLNILDAFGTVEELRAAHPTGEPGDAYSIGTEIFIWSEQANDWVSIGQLKGEPGESGTDGISPIVTVTEITGGHRVEITDAEGTESFDVMDGNTGAGSWNDLTDKPFDEDTPLDIKYLPMDEIVDAVIAAIPSAEEANF